MTGLIKNQIAGRFDHILQTYVEDEERREQEAVRLEIAKLAVEDVRRFFPPQAGIPDADWEAIEAQFLEWATADDRPTPPRLTLVP